MELVTLLAAAMIAVGTPGAPAHEHRIAQVVADPINQWEPLITEAAQRFGIERAWIRVVMRAESAGQTTLNGRPITSPAGAMGLMQVMPETYAEMRGRHGLGSDPYDPRDNILAGTAFLKAMFDRFGYPGLFAAYNAGPERYEAWLRRGTPLPAETLNYLRGIGSEIAETVLGMGPPTLAERSGKASSAPSIEPRFTSGKTLFFITGSSSETSNQVAEKVNSRRNRGSIFVSQRRESIPSATPSDGPLFVPLSHRPQ